MKTRRAEAQCSAEGNAVFFNAWSLLPPTPSNPKRVKQWTGSMHTGLSTTPPRRPSGEARTKANTRNLKRLRRRRPSPRRLRDRYSGEKASFPSAGLCQIARDSTDISPSSRTRSRIFFGGGEASLPSSRLKRFQCLSSWPRRHPLTDQEAGSRETAHVPEISVAIFAEPAPRYGEPRE